MSKEQSDDTVTIPREEYERLQVKATFLQALQGCDVEKWSGYQRAIEEYEEIKGQDDPSFDELEK